MILNKSYIGMKIISLACLVFFFQQLFIASLILVFNPELFHFTHIPRSVTGILLWLFDLVFVVFIVTGLMGAMMTYSLKEQGRRILVAALFGLLLFHALAIYLEIAVPGYSNVLFPSSLLIYVFLFNSIFVLTHKITCEHFTGGI